LEANVLYGVLLPKLELKLGDEEQWQGELEEDRLDVLLTQSSHLGLA